MYYFVLNNNGFGHEEQNEHTSILLIDLQTLYHRCDISQQPC